MADVAVLSERNGRFLYLPCLIPFRYTLGHSGELVPIARRTCKTSGGEHVAIPIENKRVCQQRNAQDPRLPYIRIGGFDERIAELCLRKAVVRNWKYFSRIAHRILLSQNEYVGTGAARKRFR